MLLVFLLASNSIWKESCGTQILWFRILLHQKHQTKVHICPFVGQNEAHWMQKQTWAAFKLTKDPLLTLWSKEKTGLFF